MKKILVAVALASLVAFASPALAAERKVERECEICGAKFDNQREIRKEIRKCPHDADGYRKPKDPRLPGPILDPTKKPIPHPPLFPPKYPIEQ